MTKNTLVLLLLLLIVVWLFARVEIAYGVRHLLALTMEPGDAVRVEGTVIQSERMIVVSDHSRSWRHPYRVDYNFITREGHSARGSDVVFGSGHAPGNHVNVSYWPSNPAHNRIVQPGELPMALLSVAFAIACIVIAATAVVRSRA